jgi:formate dehydrogenase maturation protein FdhE
VNTSDLSAASLAIPPRERELHARAFAETAERLHDAGDTPMANLHQQLALLLQLDLVRAVSNLGPDKRQAMARAVSELRDQQAAAGSPRVAAWLNLLAAFLVDVTAAESATLDAVADQLADDRVQIVTDES